MKKTVMVPFDEDDLLVLHAYAVLADGRTHLVQMLRHNISPVAERVLKRSKKSARGSM